jgi:hypothetical protein
MLTSLAIGPLALHILGDPYGFSFDYETTQRLFFTLLVRGSCILATSLLAGLVLGRIARPSARVAFLAANPLSFAAGMAVYYWIVQVFHVGDSDSYRSSFWITLVSPLVFAPIVFVAQRASSLWD